MGPSLVNRTEPMRLLPYQLCVLVMPHLLSGTGAEKAEVHVQRQRLQAAQAAQRAGARK